MMVTNHNTITPAVNILVVDDSVESLKLLTEILTQAGYQVRPAERPQLALKSVLAHPPSLILLDVRMPGMSGFELCRRLKQDERTQDIPIIFVSALQDVADRVQGFEAGGVDFVSKPFEESEVLARVTTHLQLHNMRLHQEELVAMRTAELTETNETLLSEVTERKQAEQDLQEYQRRLKALASELTLAEERERRRIAADLHDHVSQSLSLARIQLGKARDMSSESRRNVLIDDALRTLKEAIQDTRTLIFELSSPLLNELGLETAVSAWLRVQIGTKYDLETKFLTDNQEKPLTEDVQAILFRNVRELLANVVRHAQASEIQVSIERQGADFTIIIQDDGIGFDPESFIKEVHPKGGFGLFSIQERMADLGGSFEISSTPGKGCTAVLTGPLDLE